MGKRSWWEPITIEPLEYADEDPLILQIRHFAGLVRGEVEPLVSGLEGLKTLQVIEAVKESARTGESITLEP
ncbi:MAG: hypothetical protein H8E94_00095 [Alphaproteobacteria bacterium]|nr:hypothetical protein [Alphaproteobacteria bacterium]